MGKITQEDMDKLPKSEKKKINKAKEEVLKTMPEEGLPEKDPFKEISEDVGFIFKELTYFSDWIAELETKLNKVARRLGL